MKEFMKSLAYKMYIQILFPVSKKPVEYISTFFALIGGYFTLCEIEQAVFKTQIPVSYTHLDVYKRQAESKGIYYDCGAC